MGRAAPHHSSHSLLGYFHSLVDNQGAWAECEPNGGAERLGTPLQGTYSCPFAGRGIARARSCGENKLKLAQRLC